MSDKPSIKDYLVTVFFLPAFLSILVFYDLVQRIAHIFSSKYLENIYVILNSSLVALLKLCGNKFSYHIPDEVKALQQMIVVSNHQSLMDVPILVDIFRKQKLKFIAKKELTKFIPFISYNLRNNHHLIIDRSKGEEAINKITQFGAEIKNKNFSVAIFPEGTRARDGKMKPFKMGGLKAILDSCPDIPVVAVTIDGSWQLAKYKLKPFYCGAKIKVAARLVKSTSSEDLIREIESICRSASCRSAAFQAACKLEACAPALVTNRLSSW